jgi:hypothetical protein
MNILTPRNASTKISTSHVTHEILLNIPTAVVSGEGVAAEVSIVFILNDGDFAPTK